MAILDVIKTAAKVAREAGRIDLYGQILEVYEKLLEQQKQIDALEEDNKKLRKEIDIKRNLVSSGNLYWLKSDETKDGPFCTRCWDDEQKLIRLHKAQVSGRVFCPKCNTTAHVSSAQAFSPISHRTNPGR